MRGGTQLPGPGQQLLQRQQAIEFAVCQGARNVAGTRLEWSAHAHADHRAVLGRSATDFVAGTGHAYE